jgi:creatinine amidohydrolase/Fe(II)-dependent formamide hydrolase-like protein
MQRMELIDPLELRSAVGGVDLEGHGPGLPLVADYVIAERTGSRFEILGADHGQKLLGPGLSTLRLWHRAYGAAVGNSGN